jgi:hypothetical protein
MQSILHAAALQSQHVPNRIATMTQIVSVSAATAAYATEGLKPSARISGSPHTAEATQLQAREARHADTLRHNQMMDVVGPAAIAVFFLTAGERSRLLAQTTRQEAEEAYAFGKRDEVEETEERRNARDEEQPEEDASGESSDQPFEEKSEVIALPAPEEFS